MPKNFLILGISVYLIIPMPNHCLFQKTFFELNGVSPITYVHNLRIKKAKEMLRSDHGNITDIAPYLGYNNIYEFSKAFKKSYRPLADSVF